MQNSEGGEEEIVIQLMETYLETIGRVIGEVLTSFDVNSITEGLERVVHQGTERDEGVERGVHQGTERDTLPEGDSSLLSFEDQIEALFNPNISTDSSFLTPSKEEEEVKNKEEEEVVVVKSKEECKICLSREEKSQFVKCPQCHFESCFECYKMFFGTTSSPAMMCMNPDCKVTWSLEFAGMTSSPLRKLVSQMTKPRLVQNALQREKSLLSSTTEIANVVRMRRLVLESLIQLRCENSFKASEINVLKIKGDGDSFPYFFEDGDVDVDVVDDDLIIIREVVVLASSSSVDNSEKTKEKVHSLLEKVFDSLPTTPTGKTHLQNLCILAGLISKISPSSSSEQILESDFALDKVRFADAVAFAKDESKTRDEKIKYLNQQQKKYISRANHIHIFHRFLSDVPKEVWFSICAFDVIDSLFECIKARAYGSLVYDRKIIRTISLGVREKNKSSNLFSDMILSSGRSPVQPCFNCRGHMYKLASSASIIECNLCKEVACLKCRESAKAGEHACKDENVLSIEHIETTTKPCPGCAAPITRTEGCRHMFCSRCKQPYDWETLKPLASSNTNPDYHAWLEEIRRQPLELLASSSSSSSLPLSLQARERDSIGEDGMTQLGRINALYVVYERNGFFILSSILIILFNIERKFVRKAFDKIPKAYDFESLRVHYLNNDLTEEEFEKKIGSLEISSIILNKIVILLDNFLYEAIEETKKPFRVFEEEEEEGGRQHRQPRPPPSPSPSPQHNATKEHELEVLRVIHDKANEVNRAISSYLSLLESSSFLLFPNLDNVFASSSFLSVSNLAQTTLRLRVSERRLITKVFDFSPFEPLNHMILATVL